MRFGSVTGLAWVAACRNLSDKKSCQHLTFWTSGLASVAGCPFENPSAVRKKICLFRVNLFTSRRVAFVPSLSDTSRCISAFSTSEMANFIRLDSAGDRENICFKFFGERIGVGRFLGRPGEN